MESDEYSIFQEPLNNDCGFNLDSIYPYQFVQNEEVVQLQATDNQVLYHHLQYTPLAKGTLTGLIYEGNNAIQVFQCTADDVFKFGPVADYKLDNFVTSGSENNGFITFEWNKPITNSKLIVSYEYKDE